jgi:hypothetical protein
VDPAADGEEVAAGSFPAPSFPLAARARHRRQPWIIGRGVRRSGLIRWSRDSRSLLARRAVAGMRPPRRGVRSSPAAARWPEVARQVRGGQGRTRLAPRPDLTGGGRGRRTRSARRRWKMCRFSQCGGSRFYVHRYQGRLRSEETVSMFFLSLLKFLCHISKISKIDELSTKLIHMETTLNSPWGVETEEGLFTDSSAGLLKCSGLDWFGSIFLRESYTNLKIPCHVTRSVHLIPSHCLPVWIRCTAAHQIICLCVRAVMSGDSKLDFQLFYNLCESHPAGTKAPTSHSKAPTRPQVWISIHWSPIQ